MSLASQGKRGLVISDLHLFARRSDGIARMESLRGELRSVDVLVLNGDIFDFRWSTLPGHAATQTAALKWLRDLVADFPDCEVHFMMGNHDCLAAFCAGLDDLAEAQPRFHWHKHEWRVGSALFLHGDCAHRLMDAAGLEAYRRCWRRHGRKGALQSAAYSCACRLRIPRCVNRLCYPPRRTIRRIMHYLDLARPNWREDVRDCYFGHTHLPFSIRVCDGIRFHNTGSAIRHMRFSPASFEIGGVQDTG